MRLCCLFLLRCAYLREGRRRREILGLGVGVGAGGGSRIGNGDVGGESSWLSIGEGGDGDMFAGRRMLGEGGGVRNRVMSCWVELLGFRRVVVFGGGRWNVTECWL